MSYIKKQSGLCLSYNNLPCVSRPWKDKYEPKIKLRTDRNWGYMHKSAFQVSFHHWWTMPTLIFITFFRILIEKSFLRKFQANKFLLYLKVITTWTCNLKRVMLHGTIHNDARFLAQHSVAILLLHFFEWLQHCCNIATLCCAKNRRC